MNQTSELKENRLFIRRIGRIENTLDDASFKRRFDHSNCDPTISGSLTLSVPVIPFDTFADTKGIIGQMVKAGYDPAQCLTPGFPLNHSQTESGQPYSPEDWDAAIKAFCRSHPDADLTDAAALPFNVDEGFSPTNLMVQIIQIDNQAAALDLYMECIDRFAKGEKDFADEIPESYLDQDSAFVSPDGQLFSREDAALDAGVSVEDIRLVSFRDLMTGAYQLPSISAEPEPEHQEGPSV